MPDSTVTERFERSLSNIVRNDSARAEVEKDRAAIELEKIRKAQADCLAVCIDQMSFLAQAVGALPQDRRQAYAALKDSLDDLTYGARAKLKADIDDADEEISKGDRI